MTCDAGTRIVQPALCASRDERRIFGQWATIGWAGRRQIDPERQPLTAKSDKSLIRRGQPRRLNWIGSSTETGSPGMSAVGGGRGEPRFTVASASPSSEG